MCKQNRFRRRRLSDRAGAPWPNDVDKRGLLLGRASDPSSVVNVNIHWVIPVGIADLSVMHELAGASLAKPFAIPGIVHRFSVVWAGVTGRAVSQNGETEQQKAKQGHSFLHRGSLIL